MELAKLDINAKYKTKYCVPLWLRDEQVKHAIQATPGRVREVQDMRRPEKIAVVGFGPSLQDTWEEIKGFQYIVSCSGSHRFLIDKGIIPTWHVEVDPRAHKVQVLGEPHPDTTYLPASTCHPEYIAHLKKHRAKIELWHVFSNESEVMRVLPFEEWAFLGGSDVGLRAAVLARFFGFTDLHLFGMDGCAREMQTHTTLHPNAPKQLLPLDYNGKTYLTSIGLMECAKQWGHELDQMPDVRPTFHGNGLIQDMWRGYQPKKNDKRSLSTIAVRKPKLISDEYKALNAQLHNENLAFGVGGAKHAVTVVKLVQATKSHSVLDYGCGKGYLAKSLPFPIWEYDPAVEGKAESPRPADVVTCFDVLEHIEPEKIDFVLGDLQRCVLKVGYFVIHTGPSSKTLSDGRNAHILQQPRPYWETILAKYFEIGKITEQGPLLHVVVGAKRVPTVTPEQIVDAAVRLGR